MINHINSSLDEDKFLYITPFLTEVERIKSSCPSKKFKEPQVYGTKINGIKYLFEHGDNIVSTHSLFSGFNDTIMNLTKFQGYTLIMDEVADVVQPLAISEHDLNVIIERFAHIDENCKLIWDDIDYTGEYNKYKNMCELSSVYVYGEASSRMAFIWIFPVEVFKAFKEVYILSYMFYSQVQRYYYDYFSVDYDYIDLNDYNKTVEREQYDGSKFQEIIDVCNQDSVNRIGSDIYSLSVGWYKRNIDTGVLTILKNNTINYFKNIIKTSSKQNIWTTFKDYKECVKGKGYSKGYLPFNIRATNDYIDKSCIAYLCNIYINPIIKNFFISHGITVDEDGYALSELIQFIFRTRLRKGENISIYIPSRRMRNLLLGWLGFETEEETLSDRLHRM